MVLVTKTDSSLVVRVAALGLKHQTISATTMINIIIAQITPISVSAISTENISNIPTLALASGHLYTVITLLVLVTSTMVTVTNTGSTCTFVQNIAVGKDRPTAIAITTGSTETLRPIGGNSIGCCLVCPLFYSWH